MSGSETISLRGVPSTVVVDVGLQGGLREAFVKIFLRRLLPGVGACADAFFGAANFDFEPSHRWRAAIRIARFGSPWAGPGRNSFFRAKREWSWTVQFRASEARIAISTARLLRTGRVPGKPRHTGQTLVFGGSPKRVEQPQKIFVLVRSWTWDFQANDRLVFRQDFGGDGRFLWSGFRHKGVKIIAPAGLVSSQLSVVSFQ